MIMSKFLSHNAISKLLYAVFVCIVALENLTVDSKMCHYNYIIIIRLEAMLRPNIRFTPRSNLAVFTHSAITPPEVNRFG